MPQNGRRVSEWRGIKKYKIYSIRCSGCLVEIVPFVFLQINFFSDVWRTRKKFFK